MKLQSLLLVSLASVALAAPSWWEQWTLSQHESIVIDEDMRLVQTAEDAEPFWASEKERLSMFRNDIKFMDITDYQDLGSSRFAALNKKRKCAAEHFCL